MQSIASYKTELLSVLFSTAYRLLDIFKAISLIKWHDLLFLLKLIIIYVEEVRRSNL